MYANAQSLPFAVRLFFHKCDHSVISAKARTSWRITMRFFIAALLLISSPPLAAQHIGAGQKVALTNNQEMTAIFAADQAARDHPAAIDWKVLLPADKARRAQTQALLDAGKLSSADDFYHAAYVFQHGDEAEDCLKAHALAVVAVARGKREATWIAAATLDRYLQRIGQPQIYGTQFLRPPGQKWTQEPYRRDLLSDSVRQASGVPPLAAQEGQRKDWERKVP
ncbi:MULTISPECIES: hypothetical protein [unclassified Sphingomonas]|uniref:hypothetical protein n=1 Tax=unclassified Sphingomonas TaxID=196159 RepID=UPI002857ED20|nr:MULTISPECIES: hypothetical protein [unclassified Sphingomonas]MDR6116775.1 hypothetical protein [Sphingomonas sp. SORGH_AS_0789]MDR6151887.1 hypothetical protein [Sphingomonas sp. SORGH_AS_0742]